MGGWRDGPQKAFQCTRTLASFMKLSPPFPLWSISATHTSLHVFALRLYSNTNTNNPLKKHTSLHVSALRLRSNNNTNNPINSIKNTTSCPLLAAELCACRMLGAGRAENVYVTLGGAHSTVTCLQMVRVGGCVGETGVGGMGGSAAPRWWVGGWVGGE